MPKLYESDLSVEIQWLELSCSGGAYKAVPTPVDSSFWNNSWDSGVNSESNKVAKPKSPNLTCTDEESFKS